MGDIKAKIVGKIIIKATVTNTGNFLVGSGKGDTYDFELIKQNGRIYIPASGFIGMLKKHFDKRVNLKIINSKDTKRTSELFEKQAEYFWGSDKSKQSNTSQSHIIIDDLECNVKPIVMVRDGVAIDTKKGIGIPGHKYDYEFIEKDAEFNLYMEITLRQGFCDDIFLQFVKFIIVEGSTSGNYRQGAFSSHDFGNLIWKGVPEVHLIKFNSGNAENSQKWFDYLKSENGKIDNPAKLPDIFEFKVEKLKSVCITGIFSIKNTLMIGASDDSLLQNNLDKTHIKDSKGTPLITSKSIRGPVRHRALKILNTIGNKNATQIIDGLFGIVDEINNNKKKGKIIFREVSIDKDKIDTKQIQPRIKIDRFTGGTMKTALLSTQPLWHKEEEITLNFEIEKYSNDEIAIMLLVMKDLMNEDLPIGGEKAIGRGVLTGTKLTIRKDEKNYFERDVLEDGTIKIVDKGEFTKAKIESMIKDLNKIN